MPDRARRVVVLAHCHLNVNTKVHGLASYEGARAEVVAPYIESGCGVIQLPCPEATYLGMARWGMTKEQYETPAYRRHCESLLLPVVDTLAVLAADDCAIEAVVGVDGSPSCGVERTCVGYRGGELGSCARAGEPGPCAGDGTPQSAAEVPGAGVFMEVFRSLLDAAGLDVQFRGVEEIPGHRG